MSLNTLGLLEKTITRIHPLQDHHSLIDIITHVQFFVIIAGTFYEDE